jgi:hypothetical protein
MVLASVSAVNAAVASASAVTVTRAEHLIRQLVAVSGLSLSAAAATAAAAIAAGGGDPDCRVVAAARRAAIAGAVLLFCAACAELSLRRRRWRAARLAAACRAELDARWQRAAAAGGEAWAVAAAATETLARELGVRAAAAGDLALRQEAECAEQLAVQAEAADMLLRRKVPHGATRRCCSITLSCTKSHASHSQTHMKDSRD